MNLNFSEKNLIIQIKSQDEEFEIILKITPWGIEGSSKLVNYEEGSETYFGSDEYINDVRLIFIILFRELLILFCPVKLNLTLKRK